LIDKQPIGIYGWAQKTDNKVGIIPIYFEMDFNSLVDFAVEKIAFKKINDFPYVEHDLTFLVSTDIDYNNIINTVMSLDKKIVKFYSAKGLYKQSDNSRSATFKIVFQAGGHTLTNAEIEKLRNKVIGELPNKFRMELKK